MNYKSKKHLSNWCQGGPCACTGCANFSFNSKTEWQQWVLSVGGTLHTKWDTCADLSKVAIPGTVKLFRVMKDVPHRMDIIKRIAQYRDKGLVDAKKFIEEDTDIYSDDAEKLSQELNDLGLNTFVVDLDFMATPVLVA